MTDGSYSEGAVNARESVKFPVQGVKKAQDIAWLAVCHQLDKTHDVAKQSGDFRIITFKIKRPQALQKRSCQFRKDAKNILFFI